MSRELSAACDPDSCGPGHEQLTVHCLGVNNIGSESGNPEMCAGRILPWLQDTSAQQVWEDKWRVTFRDIVVLDAENQRVTVFNCTEHNLADPANYEALKAILLQTANRSSP
jgi:hypothetical protein